MDTRSSAPDEAQIDRAKYPLIDPRGIGEAIANDPLAGIERRQDGLLHVIVARGRKQHRLGVGPQRLCGAGQQHVTDDFSAGRTTWLARELHAYSKGSQPQRSSDACVDLPVPSPPSMVMNLPLIPIDLHAAESRPDPNVCAKRPWSEKLELNRHNSNDLGSHLQPRDEDL